jgi:hypothetical protein
MSPGRRVEVTATYRSPHTNILHLGEAFKAANQKKVLCLSDKEEGLGYRRNELLPLASLHESGSIREAASRHRSLVDISTAFRVCLSVLHHHLHGTLQPLGNSGAPGSLYQVPLTTHIRSPGLRCPHLGHAAQSNLFRAPHLTNPHLKSSDRLWFSLVTIPWHIGDVPASHSTRPRADGQGIFRPDHLNDA